MDSIVERRTGTTSGSPPFPARHGWTPPGVGVVTLRSLGSVEPFVQYSRMSTIYCSRGGTSSILGPALF